MATVIEKAYSDYNELNSYIKAALPSWVHYDAEPVTVNYDKYMKYYVGTSDAQTGILIYGDPDKPNGNSGGSVWGFNIFAKNTDLQLDYVPNINASSSSSTKLDEGIVRIFRTDHAFGIVLYDSTYKILQGATIAYKGSVDDKKYWAIIGDPGGSLTGLVCQGTRDTNNTWSKISTNTTEQTVLLPFADWLHGDTDPLEDVYIMLTAPANGTQNALKDADGNTYYRCSAHSSSSSNSSVAVAYIKVKKEG